MSEEYAQDLFRIDEIYVKNIVFGFDPWVTLWGCKYDETNDSFEDIDYGLTIAQLNSLLMYNKDFGLEIQDIIADELIKLIEEPIDIDLMNLFGKPILFEDCYLDVYKSKNKDENGKWIEDEDQFYIIDNIIPKDSDNSDLNDKSDFTKKLNEFVDAFSIAYIYYERLIKLKLSQREARKRAGLKDELIFHFAYICFKNKKQ